MYILALISGVIAGRLADTSSTKLTAFVWFLPTTIFLTILLSIQDGVGTDYQSYLDVASGKHDGGWIISKGEVLFLQFISWSKLLNEPQWIFFFSAVVQMTFSI